jgi:hypothetical protein
MRFCLFTCPYLKYYLLKLQRRSLSLKVLSFYLRKLCDYANIYSKIEELEKKNFSEQVSTSLGVIYRRFSFENIFWETVVFA